MGNVMIDTDSATPARIAWIDTARGLGIIAVVAGHIYVGVTPAVLYMFHMPFFFFLSGYLYRPRSDERGWLIDKSLHLLVPYCSFLLLLLGPGTLSHLLAGGPRLYEYVSPILGGRLLMGETGTFWFVSCLFIVQQLMNALMIRFSPLKVGLMMLVLLVLGDINSLVWPWYWLPLNANVVLVAAPFFFAGYLARRADIAFSRYLWLVLPVCVLAVIIELTWHHNRYDMKNAFYGTPLLTPVSALSLIVLVLGVAQLLQRFPARWMFAECGSASMTIMFLHQWIQMTMTEELDLEHTHLRMAAGLLLPILVHKLASLHFVGRALLLGSVPDSRKLFSPLMPPDSASR